MIKTLHSPHQPRSMQTIKHKYNSCYSIRSYLFGTPCIQVLKFVRERFQALEEGKVTRCIMYILVLRQTKALQTLSSTPAAPCIIMKTKYDPS